MWLDKNHFSDKKCSISSLLDNLLGLEHIFGSLALVLNNIGALIMEPDYKNYYGGKIGSFL